MKERKGNSSAIRVTKDCSRKFKTELARINEKTFGRRLRSDELITHFLSLLTNQDRLALQEGTMSNQDLIERDYQEYCATHQKITKDEYFGMLRQGPWRHLVEHQGHTNLSPSSHIEN
jgi:hypothetical protein